MDLDMRKLRYFVAVAQRLHFGQAAAALYITQPALSRQIRQFEHELGVELFERNSRQVRLTPAGKRLAEDGARLLADGDAAVARARRAGAGGLSLTVGFMLGMDIAPVLAQFGRSHPDVDVQLQRLHWWNHATALRDGRVDAGFVRLPLPTDGLEIRELHTEPICVTLPAGHPLAGRASVDIAELADEPVLRYADARPEWNAPRGGVPARTRHGEHRSAGRGVRPGGRHPTGPGRAGLGRGPAAGAHRGAAQRGPGPARLGS
jgi:DNA-binding transcriptional LysR family regulator